MELCDMGATGIFRVGHFFLGLFQWTGLYGFHNALNYGAIFTHWRMGIKIAYHFKDT